MPILQMIASFSNEAVPYLNIPATQLTQTYTGVDIMVFDEQVASNKKLKERNGQL